MVGTLVEKLIVVFLVAFVIAYMYTHRVNITRLDMGILAVGVVMLLVNYVYIMAKDDGRREHFAEPAPVDVLSLAPLPTEEDFSKLIKSFPSVIVYLTAFNKRSYPGSGIEWINVANRPTDQKECSARNNRVFAFNNAPVYTKGAGLMLGSNRLFGPLCNEIGISLQSTFTVCFSCRHGDLVPDNEKEIELLKLYANSSTNNGMALFVQSKSVKINNGVQSGNLFFQFVDEDSPAKCLVQPTDTSFTFDKLNMSMFFIVKDVDKIRVLYMVGESPIISVLATINTKETVANFSNKEMVINRFQNWKGGLYHFGVFPDALTDNSITDIYNHCFGEYQKANNENYLKLTGDYNSILDYLNKYTKCPYDENVCKACGTVSNWTDMNQVMTAPASCRETIDQFCRANTKHVLCKCWDTTYAGYQSDSCKVYRNMFNPQARIFDNITKDDIQYIKDKHNLISPEECPKPVIPKTSCVNENLAKNTYSEYDYENIKIKPKFMSGTSTSKVDKPYALEDTKKDTTTTASTATTSTSTTAKKDGSYMFKPITVGSTTATPNADAIHAFRVPSETTKINNMYLTDGNINYDAADNVALQELKKTDAAKEQTSPFFKSLVSFFLP